MYRTTIEGRVICITNRDHERLLKRFDYNSGKVGYDGNEAILVVRRKCVLCEKHNNRCKGCPFSQFKSKYSKIPGCRVFISKVLGLGSCSPQIFISAENISWDRRNHTRAKEVMDRIYSFLMAMEKM